MVAYMEFTSLRRLVLVASGGFCETWTVVLRFFLVLNFFTMEAIVFRAGYWDQLGYWMDVRSSDTGVRMGGVLIGEYDGVKCVAGFAPCVWFDDEDLSRELVASGCVLERV